MVLFLTYPVIQALAELQLLHQALAAVLQVHPHQGLVGQLALALGIAHFELRDYNTVSRRCLV